MSNKNRRNIDDEIKVYRGVIPWSVAEHDWIVATFDERRKKNENLPLPEEFADIFRQRYPKKLEYDAHFFRFNQINKFMQTHHDEFIKMKFVAVQGGKHRIAPQLIETLCTILYDQEEFDESGEFIGCTFSFPDVVEVTRLKMSVHLN